MNYFLTEEQQMIKELARRIAEEKILPVRAEYDEKEQFPWDVVKELAQADLFGVYIPEEYNGMGFGIFELCLAIEELSRVCGGIALAYAGTALGTFPILLFGNEQQKKKYLPYIAKGEKIAAFAVTESGAGSDITTLNTTAKKEGDFYILNGTKQWITNGGEAEIYVVIAATDKTKGPRGLSAFILEKGMDGFNFGKKENKLGIRASATRELIFENCKVPAENLLGKEGMGFIITLKNFDASRPGVAAQALGIAQGAFEAAVGYARQRKQFGQTIISFQAVQHILADMSTQIEAARTLIYQTARSIDSGGKDYSGYSAMCKLFASDTAMKVTTDAIQIFGGYGYMKEYPVEKMFRDAKITQIYEGTNQMQRNFIASDIIKKFGAHKK
ncbi:MAG: acyl-CoA dehydrogenase family protein [Candidatus Ratteibacteria bacterium]|nr:acyl-CoA dehydrogenase family protein [Candidatus Ratteibacteria bacterium]